MQELHLEIRSRALDRAGKDNAKPESKVDQTRDKAFDPQVSFKPPASDKIRKGYLHL